MNLIDIHEKCIATIEGIEHFKKMRESSKENLTGICGTFPKKRIRYEKDIDTYTRAIERLQKRYINYLNLLPYEH